MSKKKDWQTAEEFMAELEMDPDYQRRRRERDEKFRRLAEKYAELNRPILERLRAIGVEAGSIEEVVKNYSPLSEEIVSILLEYVEPNEDERHCESLVRALAAARAPFDGRVLARCYETTFDEALRWAIGNTIAIVKPHSIGEWIDALPQHSALRKELLDLGYFK